MNDFSKPSELIPPFLPHRITPITYEIRVEGILTPEWSEWFDGMTLTHDTETNETHLTGTLPDQAALHGHLAKIRDLGLNLVQVARHTPTAKP